MAKKDYLASLKVEPADQVDHGIKGMKWGIRRSSSQLRAAAKTRKAAQPETGKTGTQSSGKAPTPHLQNQAQKVGIQAHVESSPARYARLKAEAKAGKASQMTEQDLKFFNARTEALAKVNKMNEKKSGWLADTTKTVLLSSTQKSMQAVSDSVANKYISGPIIDAINKK
jgi:glucan-binding YG repeat protein